jgi:hypothetical protein
VQNQGLDRKRSFCFLAFDTELTTDLQGSAAHGIRAPQAFSEDTKVLIFFA